MINTLSNLEEIAIFRRNYHAAKLIIDTNTLLLLFVGTYDLNYLSSCPLMTDNGKNYKSRDFDVLKKIIQIFVGNVVITPHVLSEVNMLVRKRIKEPHRTPHFGSYAKHGSNTHTVFRL